MSVSFEARKARAVYHKGVSGLFWGVNDEWAMVLMPARRLPG